MQDTTEQASDGTAVFPSLAPGDTIDLTYRVEDYHPGALAQQFWAEWAFASPDTPVKLSRFALMVPAQMTFNTREHGTVPKPLVKETNGWRLSEWRMSDVPADLVEPSGTDFRDHGTWLDILTIPDWHTIINWYRDLADPRCTPDETIRTKALELTQDAKTTEEKIQAIVNFVARQIRYQSMPFRFSQYIPTEGKQVLREHYGDCKDKAALVAALLAAIDVHAEMVLLNGRDDGITPYLPSPRFSHAINCIQTEKGPLWIDATANKMAFGILPLPDQGVPALIISPVTTELTQTPILPPNSNGINLDTELTLDTTGKLSGDIEIDFVGNWGWMLRNVLSEVPESKRDLVLRYTITKFTANSTYDSGMFHNLDDPDKPLVISGKFHLDHATTVAGDFIILPIPWANAENEEGLSLLSRKQDLDTALGYGLQRMKMQLTLPDGYSLEGLKPKFEATSPWGSHTITYHQEGNILYGEWDYINTVLSISAKDYPKYRDYALSQYQEDKKALVLKT